MWGWEGGVEIEFKHVANDLINQSINCPCRMKPQPKLWMLKLGELPGWGNTLPKREGDDLPCSPWGVSQKLWVWDPPAPCPACALGEKAVIVSLVSSVSRSSKSLNPRGAVENPGVDSQSLGSVGGVRTGRRPLGDFVLNLWGHH